MGNDFDNLNFDGQSDDNNWSDDLFSDIGGWGGDDPGVSDGYSGSGGQSGQGINVDNEDFRDAVNATGYDQGASDSMAPGRDDLNNPADHKNSIKVAQMIIALGVIIIVAALIVYRIIQKPKTSSDSSQQNVLVQQAQNEQAVGTNGTNNVQVQPQTSTNDQVNQSSGQVNNQLGTQGNTYTTPGQTDIGQDSQNDGWIKFQSNQDAVVYQPDYVAATFTVTKVSHYVNVSDADTDYIQIKSTLSGQIQGLPGAYDIDVPYNLGSKVQVG